MMRTRYCGIILFFILIFVIEGCVSSPTLKPTNEEGVFYGRLRGSTLAAGLISRNNQYSYRISPDHRGNFELLVKEGEYYLLYLRKSADDYQRVLKPIVITSGTQIRLDSAEEALLAPRFKEYIRIAGVKNSTELVQTPLPSVDISYSTDSEDKDIIYIGLSEYFLSSARGDRTFSERFSGEAELIEYLIDNWGLLRNYGTVSVSNLHSYEIEGTSDEFNIISMARELRWVTLSE